MAKETFDKIYSILVAEGFRYVYLYLSGEPTLHPDFWYMVSRLSGAGITVNVASKLPVKLNAVEMDAAVRGLSAKLHFDITVDSKTQATQDRLMYGYMDMNIVWDNLARIAVYARHRSISASVITVANKHNKGELLDIKSAVEKLGLHWCAKPMGFYAGSVAEREDIENVSDMIGKGNSRFLLLNGKIVTKKKRCGAFLKPVIGYDGSVTICCHDFMYKASVGNVLKTGSLKKILSSKKYRDVVAAGALMKLPICEGCN